MQDGTLLEHLGKHADAVVPPANPMRAVLQRVRHGELTSAGAGEGASSDGASDDGTSDSGTAGDDTSGDDTSDSGRAGDDTSGDNTSGGDTSSDDTSGEHVSRIETSDDESSEGVPEAERAPRERSRRLACARTQPSASGGGMSTRHSRSGTAHAASTATRLRKRARPVDRVDGLAAEPPGR